VNVMRKWQVRGGTILNRLSALVIGSGERSTKLISRN